jgi:hypothetical protein
MISEVRRHYPLCRMAPAQSCALQEFLVFVCVGSCPNGVQKQKQNIERFLLFYKALPFL